MAIEFTLLFHYSRSIKEQPLKSHAQVKSARNVYPKAELKATTLNKCEFRKCVYVCVCMCDAKCAFSSE